MPIVNILKRASNFILGSDDIDDQIEFIYEDNEVLFCKNNVCVHPPAFARQESDILHYPGYLTVTTKTFTDQYNNAKRPTLLLTWIPNATLRKCPSTVENGLSTISSMKTFTDELKQNQFFSQLIEQNNCKNDLTFLTSTNPFLDPYLLNDSGLFANNSGNGGRCGGVGDNSDAISTSSNSDRTSSICLHSNVDVDCQQSQHDNEDDVFGTIELKKTIEETEDEKNLKQELEPLIETDADSNKIIEANAIKENVKTLLQQDNEQTVTSVNITIANPCIQNENLSPEEQIVQNEKFLRTQSISSVDDGSTNWMTPELLAYKHNLSFPDSQSASPILQRKIPMKCRRFSVDLSQMRSLRLFFNDENCTSGQLVIASRESQYKILHFHHGGLDHLAQVLHQWHCLLHNIKLAPGNYCFFFYSSSVKPVDHTCW